MQILKSTEPAAQTALGKRLYDELSAGRLVVWLLSGGSNIKTSTRIMDELTPELTNQLTISLIDERYGPVGHADSNAQQIIEAGFDFKQATFVPVLQDGLSMSETSLAFSETCQRIFAEADVSIGQLGIGDDGHIAGLKPGSPAIVADGWAVDYDWSDYRRISLTFETLRRLESTYTFVWGEKKHPMLDDLLHKDLPLAVQPAQIIKQLDQAYLYNDQIGG